MNIAEKANLQGTKKEILERVKSRIDSYLFPIGQKRRPNKKSNYIMQINKTLFNCKENP